MNKNKILRIISPMCPTNNHYMSYRIVKKGAKSFIQAYKPSETVAYERKFKKIIQEALEEQEWTTPPKDTFIYMDCDFYFPKKRIDPNNCYKVPCDCLTDMGVFEDDDMVLNRSQRVFYDSENPRIEITLTLAPHVGIFDNLDEYNTFLENNCNKCTRGKKGNCSIHKKALESRIQSDLDKKALTCFKKRAFSS